MSDRWRVDTESGRDTELEKRDQVVANYKYKEQVVAEKSKFIRTSTYM